MKKNIFAGNVSEKGLTMEEIGGGRLGVEQTAEFVRDLLGEDAILTKDHLIIMDKPEMDIPRTIFNTRVLKAGAGLGGEIVSFADGAHDADLNVSTVRLTAPKYRGRVGISNSVMKTNIERGNLYNTAIEQIKDQSNADIAETLWHSDKDLVGGGVLAFQDGWLKLADKVTVGSGLTGVALLQAVYGQYPTRYLKKLNGNKGVFYVTREVYDQVTDDIATRQTTLGDAKLTSEGEVFVKGIQVKHSFALDAEDIVKAVVLTPKQNLKFGFFENVTIETFVNLDADMTYFYPEVWVAAGIEVPEATVAFVEAVI